ncbi:hypothetical protein AM493_02445 [Flavobacterium akiainvivens]|uniref:Uncharacterized protein n=1 Tax=Flavobacterium akiainvivens TaxID=1202724 RepID=A0A0N0RQE8_9FLAO|nr:hypothetical protein [Flavobacterium akiainvivens]KOS05022.1 hypothetical protein AM493_02445 [Flavobacterium akiainvivens]SFQ40154.1 hypothetical protein SAMN05444144_10428 [Flavobacterium akiainvivens]
MKKIFSLLLLMAAGVMHSQDGCEYNILTTDDGVEVKSTKEYMMYERIFGNSSQFMFFSLTNSEGTPILTFQYLAKSKDFPPIYCLDKTSRIYIQLTNGKIITLVSITEDQCSGLVYDGAEQNNIRVLSGSFLFTVGSLEELEKSSISFIRVKYATETVDYPMKREFISENNGTTYKPDTYFINMLKCIKD